MSEPVKADGDPQPSPESEQGTVTRVLNAIASGEVAPEACPGFQRVYQELRGVAHARLQAEQAATFQTTDLVHEAYLKLFRPADTVWQSRAHFFGSAARAMEQLLIDAARTRRRRGMDLAEPDQLPDGRVDPIRLSEAINELASLDPELAELARLRFFAGLSVAMTAEVIGLSERTVKRRWTFARTWLFQHLRGDDEGSVSGDGAAR